jgi:hypothetical protein
MGGEHASLLTLTYKKLERKLRAVLVLKANLLIKPFMGNPRYSLHKRFCF